jgi:rare lipoprotein A (peptidoglycan hydrolase)
MVGGRMYFPREQANYDQSGLASWYGADDHGRETANGEVYDKESISAAHTTLPIPSYARVTNLDNGRSLIVRINDRGPYVGDRVIDVSERAADLLQFKGKGLGHVRVQYVGPAPIEGSDQRMLVASLRQGPASIQQDRTLIATADRVPSDGRMTGLALAHMAPPVAAAPVKPVMLAVATERAPVQSALPQSAAAFSVTPRVAGYGPHAALPPPPSRPAFQQIAIAPTQPFGHPATPPNTLGTLSAHGSQASARPAPSGTLDPLAKDGADTAPLQLGPSKAPPAPGAIARLPAPPPIPSRYGPNGSNASGSGQVVYRLTQGYAEETRSASGQSAIDRLIAGAVAAPAGITSHRIQFGSYARPENAARVAELMRPYGDVRLTSVRGALGEKLTRVELIPSQGKIPGEVISIADQLGIHAATLID